MRDWNSWYITWDKIFSAGMTVLGAAVIVLAGLDWPFGAASRIVVTLAATMWSVGGLLVLYRSVSRHTTADRVTALRLGFSVAAMAFLLAADGFGVVDRWAVGSRLSFGLLLAAAVLSDFIDGRVARRVETSRFGEEWDMQNDAVFSMLLSIAAVVFVGIGSWAIFIGLARYLFVLLIPGSHEPVTTSRGYEFFAKTVCAVEVVALAAVVADGAGGFVAAAALAVSLGAVAVSFGWFIHIMRRERLAAAYQQPPAHAREQIGLD